MIIHYHTTIDHLLAFNRFHYENSPMWRRQRLVRAMIGPGLLALVFLLWLLTRQKRFDEAPLLDAILLALFLPVIAGSAVASYYYFRWQIMKGMLAAVRKLFAEGSNRSILGACEMELAGDWLTVKRELIEGRYHLRAIEKIIVNDDFTYVYISSVNALIIPMQAFEDQCGEFVAELIDAWDNRDQPPPGPPRDRDERIVSKRV